jgi:hypothetical protein
MSEYEKLEKEYLEEYEFLKKIEEEEVKKFHRLVKSISQIDKKLRIFEQ